MFLWTKSKKLDDIAVRMLEETDRKVKEMKSKDEECSNNIEHFTKIQNELAKKEQEKIIEEYKKYCKMYNEKLYRIYYPWGNSFSFGKPYFQEKTNVVEFIDMENMKEVIIKLSETDTITVVEI